MKEELQGKLVDILTSIQTAAGKASDFALEQLPDIAQSYVAYGRAWSVFESALAALTILASAWGLRWAFRNSDEYEGASFGAGMSCGIVGFFSLVWLVLCLHSAFLVWFAPKVWLLKEIARLIK
jgi:hypothetical protein